jgi:hypothetical protein
MPKELKTNTLSRCQLGQSPNTLSKDANWVRAPTLSLKMPKELKTNNLSRCQLGQSPNTLSKDAKGVKDQYSL